MAEQLPLPLPVRAALGREDYFVSTANALAVAMVEGWRDWPQRKLVLLGPSGSGKTHLAHVWAAQSGATILPAQDLAQADIPRLAEAPACVEDVQRIAGEPAAEEALFHLHNLCLAEGRALLLTAVRPPMRWGLTLPDLQSRLEGTQSVSLSDPDDALLTALLAKLFADRQIVPDATVIPYLVAHMPRSYAAARQMTEALDRAALSAKSRITRPMAVQMVARLDEPD
ncbi:DnaA ATPase domain-containing protein [Thetidibacter halocola]|uniref:Chromosomal replication initiator DnaA n=1 Tax=Thetidibacter halocola TaxID=2827239 RepID=A0A8J7WCU0_9RHOB|nr:DnaA/Hda family protein [Thetidibacter halocola]MBS0125212.1 chromosomal replication initiator DnaA [Thetidibacter halocola]